MLLGIILIVVGLFIFSIGANIFNMEQRIKGDDAEPVNIPKTIGWFTTIGGVLLIVKSCVS